MTPSPFRNLFGLRLAVFSSVLAVATLAACADNPVGPSQENGGQISAPADGVRSQIAGLGTTGSDSANALGITPRYLAVGSTGALRAARMVSWLEGRTTYTLTSRVNLDVTNMGTSGRFHYYTQAITNLSVIKVCNITPEGSQLVWTGTYLAKGTCGANIACQRRDWGLSGVQLDRSHICRVGSPRLQVQRG